MQHIEIRVQGCLDHQWDDWLEGLTITHTERETLLAGEVPDQAALFGLLGKLRDLGVKLIAARFGNEPLPPASNAEN